MTLRETVRNLMVARHRISIELADHHVSQMDDAEVRRRFRMYSRAVSGMELSAEGPTHSSGAERSTRFSQPETMTAGLRHSTLFPTEQPGSFAVQQETARFGSKEPGPMAGRAVSAAG